MLVKVGDPAPDFQLKDETGKIRTLAEFRGKKVDVKRHSDEVLQAFSERSKNYMTIGLTQPENHCIIE